ncbi:MFS transporter [Mycolicibacterium sp. 120270]|uniref:MFS transporter n=1 Tax=Mycolicibacterium sp. 120270 TaxID=3090600 RepID=UPI00299D642D|nr:MFS transporter [Mycolicibacterium sp. 120270]MDX1883980.1 MFS transporter [Mycolicibacterium sp. 120270]
MQVMVTMDASITLVALTKIQNELQMSDAGRNWVLTSYLLTYGGLMLLGGRLGDTFGRRRTFVTGVALFTLASLLCGFAWNESSIIVARLLHGAAAAVIAPTTVSLLATAFPKGPQRNAATAVLGGIVSISVVASLVVGAGLTAVSWRMAFLVNVPIGLVVIYLARALPESKDQERKRLDVAGSVLVTMAWLTLILAISLGPQLGWTSATTIGLGMVSVAAFVAFAVVERSAKNPVVPFSLFRDRNRLATFTTIFLAGGVYWALAILIGLYAQQILGYSILRTGIAFTPFVLAVAVGTVASARLVTRFSPRTLVLAGGVPVIAATLYASTFDASIPYFPNLVVMLVAGGIGVGIINVPVMLCVIASVDVDLIGPTSAIALALQSLGGPMVLALIQVAVATRTLSLGGTLGPISSMTPAQLHALDGGFTYGLLWLAAAGLLAGGAAMFIGYTAQQVAVAQEAKKAMEE